MTDQLPITTPPKPAQPKEMATASLTARFMSFIGKTSIVGWLFCGIVSFIVWAAIFEIEQSVRAMGQVIPSARTQIIQATDGGVLLEIMVHEGQDVEAGEVLAVLEKDRADAAYQEIKARVMSLRASLLRTQAEVMGTALEFNESFDAYPNIVQHQRGYFRQRKAALDDEINMLNDNLQLAKREVELNETLLKTGDISQVELMKSQRQMNEILGKIQGAKHKYLSEARQEATKVQADLEASRFKLSEKKDVLEHTDLIAPVAGKVKYLRFNTLGGVLKAGDELMQITPTETDMIIEAKINPIDIAQLHIGQIANVKLDTFDYTTYGGLDGELVYISSDTLTEQQEQSDMNTFYRAYIRVKKDSLQNNPKLSVSQLKPGMTATADIRTKNRTVLKYIVKPIARAFDGALQQR